MSDTAITVENLSKLYRIGMREQRHETFIGALASWAKSPFTNYRRLHRLTHFGENPGGHSSAVSGRSLPVSGQPSADSEAADLIWALKDVSFEVKQGEVVGIIGRNGAGKSTLLKILSRITEPTHGRARINGRVASLLEVGTGFHAELTGRENIYLNGTILGMTKKEVERKFDEIVDFAEVEKFIDTPVKHYSSGMYVRLAFAVAAHLEPEILLVDEVLAVGDAAFQKKCIGKMGEVAERGKTVIFISHTMQAISDLCERCFWVERGRIVRDGAASEIITAYIGSSAPSLREGVITPDMHAHPTGDVYFRQIALLDTDGHSVSSILFGQNLHVQIEIDVCRPVRGMRLCLTVAKLDGTMVSVYQTAKDDPSAPILDMQPGRYAVTVKTPLRIMPGKYVVGLGAKPVPGCWGSGKTWDVVEPALQFEIQNVSYDGRVILPGGIVRPSARWEIQPLDAHKQRANCR